MAGNEPLRVLAGYDGSLSAGAAVEAAARLMPAARAWMTYLWVPPFASETLRRALWRGTAGIDAFVAAVEREGAAEAEQLAAMGVTLARAAGWTAEPLVERSLAGEGIHLAWLAEKLDAEVIVVGSRGLTGARAALNSVSDVAVHYSTRPVLVVPYPLLSRDRAALTGGPVVVGWDGSAGARHAWTAAERLFAGRRLVRVAVRDGDVRPESVPTGTERIGATLVDRHGHAGRAVAEALTRYAAEQGAAAVVVGSRGRTAVREILLGSVAMATLHHTRLPVLVAHRATE